MGSKKQKTTQTTQTDNRLSDFSQQQFNNQTAGILDTTKAYTSKPYQPYTGQLVAGLSDQQNKARELAGSSVGSWGGILGDAEATTKDALGFDGSDVSKWYNPYEDSVVAAASRDYDENTARQLNEYADGVAARGAFGNVSAGLGEAELRRGAANDKTDGLARLRYQGFNDARSAGFQNQQAQFQGAGILGNLGVTKQGLAAADVDMLEKLGATSRDVEQAALLAEKARYDAAAADELQKFMIELSARQGILGATPMITNSGTTATGTTKVSDPMGQLAGLLSGVGALGSF